MTAGNALRATKPRFMSTESSRTPRNTPASAAKAPAMNQVTDRTRPTGTPTAMAVS